MLARALMLSCAVCWVIGHFSGVAGKGVWRPVHMPNAAYTVIHDYNIKMPDGATASVHQPRLWHPLFSRDTQ